MSQTIIKIEKEEYVLSKKLTEGIFVTTYEGEKKKSSEKCLIKIVQYSNELLLQIESHLKRIKGYQLYLPAGFLKILNYELEDVSKQLLIAQEFCGLEKITKQKGEIQEIFLTHIIREIIRIYSSEEVRVFSELAFLTPLNSDQIYYDSESCDLKIDVINFYASTKKNPSLFSTKENIKNLAVLCYELLGCKEKKVEITKCYQNFIFYLLFSEKLEWKRLSNHFLISQLENDKELRPSKDVEKMKILMYHNPESFKSAIKNQLNEITSKNNFSNSLKDFLFQLYCEKVLKIEKIFDDLDLNMAKTKGDNIETPSIYHFKSKIEKSLDFLKELNKRRRNSIDDEPNFFKIFLFASGRCLLYHYWLYESYNEAIEENKNKHKKYIHIFDASNELNENQKNEFKSLFDKQIKEIKNKKKILKRTIKELNQLSESIKKGELKNFYDFKELGDVKTLESWFQMGVNEDLEKQHKKLLEKEFKTFLAGFN